MDRINSNARQQRPEYTLPFPYPLIKSAIACPQFCMCSWGWSPALGGPETPYVLKFFSTACSIHAILARHYGKPKPSYDSRSYVQ